MDGTSGQLLVPIPEACEVLGKIGRTTLYEKVNSGELVKVSIGRRAFITAASLFAYVERLSDAAGADRAAEGDPRGVGVA